MPFPRAKLLRIVVFLLIGCATVGAAAAAMWIGPQTVKGWLKPEHGETTPSELKAPVAERAPGAADTLRLPADVVRKLDVRTAEARAAIRPLPLPPLAGQLAFDTNRLARVHARFAGEVVEIGSLVDSEAERTPSGQTLIRPLRYGDHVEKGQLLAIVWSKDLGEKKSELIDAVSRLHADREVLRGVQELYGKGSTSVRSLRDAERNVEADEIALGRAERTLRSWRLTDEEIKQIKAEAEHLRQPKDRAAAQGTDRWAQVEVRAPFDGTIVEKNVAVNDIVDTTTDLFKIADLSRLAVWAHAYEEDLPLLQELRKPIHWTIRLKANPDLGALSGTVDKIGDVIDPNQHTALVIGQVENPRGELKVGQFITATLELPPAPGEVEIPTTALVEDGQESIVFVQPDARKPEYTMQRVSVARRYHDVVYVRSGAPTEEQGGSEAEAKEVAPLQPGTLVVTAGAVEMKAALEDLQATARAVK